jgi:hypothetical protein
MAGEKNARKMGEIGRKTSEIGRKMSEIGRKTSENKGMKSERERQCTLLKMLENGEKKSHQ